MKKKTIFNTLISITAFSLFASMISLSFVSHHKDEIKEASAVSDMNSGVFRMITDSSDLNNEDQIIIASDDNWSGYNAISGINNDEKKLTIHNFDEDVAYLDDEGYLIASETHAEIFQVYKDDDGAVAFLGTTRNESLSSRYICLDDDYGHIIPQTMDNKQDNCSWYLLSQGGGNFRIQNKARLSLYFSYTNDGEYVYGNIKINAVNFRIFKKISCEDIEVLTNPRHQTYYKNEDKDLIGLTLKYNLKDGTSFTIKAEEASQIVYINWVNNREICVNAISGSLNGGYQQFYFPYTAINNPNYVYTKIDSSSYNDYRGSYLLVYDKGDGTGYAFDNTLSNLNQKRNYYQVSISNNQISGVNSYYEQHLQDISRYTIFSMNSYYMGMGDSTNYFAGDSDNDIRTTFFETNTNRITFFDNDHNLNISGAENLHFVYNEAEERFMFSSSNEHHEISIFKLGLTSSVSSELDSFRQSFVTYTKNCDETGKDKNIKTEDWETLRGLFNNLSTDAQGYLANLSYNHGQEDKDSLKDIVDRYDYIISKYSDFDDFMDRKLVNTHEDHYSQGANNQSLLSINNNKENIIIIVTLISISSIASLCIFLGIRKKKHN